MNYRTLAATAGLGIALGIASGVPAFAAESRLADALANGDKTAAVALLKQKADVNAPQVDGTTPLHWAAQMGDAALADQLIKAGAKVNVVNRYGVTPLLAAASEGTGSVVDLLIKAGADVNYATENGETALLAAARAANADAVKSLIAAKAQVNAKEKGRNQTALMWAAGTNHPEIVKMLIAAGADVNARDRMDTLRADLPPAIGAAGAPARIPLGGVTPILLAARQGDPESVKMLLEAGANINDKVVSDGASPLILAIQSTHYELAKYLIERGADVNQADSNGITPLFATVDMHKPDIVARPPRKEIDALDTVGLLQVLLAHKADPNLALQRADAGMRPGSTPFLRAAKSGDLAMMKILLDGGADPKAMPDDKASAFYLAAGGGLAAQFGNVAITEGESIEAMKFLLTKGFDVNATNGRGDTPLHAAVNKDWEQVVTFLLANGARLDAKNGQGVTPQGLAEGQGRSQLVGGSAVREKALAAIKAFTAKNAPQAAR